MTCRSPRSPFRDSRRSFGVKRSISSCLCCAFPLPSPPWRDAPEATPPRSRHYRRLPARNARICAVIRACFLFRPLSASPARATGLSGSFWRVSGLAESGTVSVRRSSFSTLSTLSTGRRMIQGPPMKPLPCGGKTEAYLQTVRITQES